MKNPFLPVLLCCWLLIATYGGIYYFGAQAVISDAYFSALPNLSWLFPTAAEDTITDNELAVANQSISAVVDVPMAINIDSTLIKQRVAMGIDTIFPGLAFNRAVDTTSGQRILLAGDSMAEALYFPFINLCRLNKYSLKLLAKRGSSSIYWAQFDSLKNVIKDYKPTLVIFTLGANELLTPSIKAHKKYFAKTLKMLDSTKFVFIGTPVWTADTNYMAMMRQLVPNTQLFNSANLTLSRQADGAHPDMKGSRVWADTITKWLVYQSDYPVIFRRVQKAKAKALPATNSVDSSFRGSVTSAPLKIAKRVAGVAVKPMG